MNKTFVYGMAVSGENFTDRVKETKRLQMDFENGLNVVLISPRRMGKTSLVKKVQSLVDSSQIQTIYMDIYDCRSEYDFYNRFAECILRQTANKIEVALENVRTFLTRIAPKIHFSVDPVSEYSFSLGITPKEYRPEEILQLPELIANHIGKHIIVCIDEFQQIAEWPDSLSVQKRLRGIWQHQQNVSYCLFGSRQHSMTQLFQTKDMPFYRFGEPNYLQPIPTADWVTFIINRFRTKKLTISPELATMICQKVCCQSSYVQQLSWNVMLNTEREVTNENIKQGIEDLLNQCSPLFMEQTAGLSTYQMNMLKAIANGLHNEFTTKENLETHNLGSKSNISRLRATLIDKDLIYEQDHQLYITDPVMEIWLQRIH